MKWVRLYTEIINDRKLRRLPADQRWLWIAVLCIARRSPNPGYLLLSDGVPVTERDLADEAEISKKSVKLGIKSFIEQMMLHEENGIFVVSHWEERQPANDDVKQRVRRHRQKKAVIGNDNVTLQDGFKPVSGNVTVTPPDTDTDIESNSSSGNREIHGTGGEPLDPHEIAAAASGKSEYVQVLDHYLAKRLELLGQGGLENDLDRQQAKAWLSEGIPLQTILDGITQALGNFKPAHKAHRISSLKYCDSAVRELHGTRDKAQKLKTSKQAEEQRILAEMKKRREEQDAFWASVGKPNPNAPKPEVAHA